MDSSPASPLAERCETPLKRSGRHRGRSRTPSGPLPRRNGILWCSVLIYSFIIECGAFRLPVISQIVILFINKFNIVFNYVISFLFILAMSLLYFIILLKINNGYIHLYFYLCILFGYLTMYFIFKKWFT